MGVIVWYEANIDYVAEELCENKDKPEMGCNGKCYLKKQLDKVDDQHDKDQAPAKKSKTELPEYIASAATIFLSHGVDEQEITYTVYSNLYSYTVTTSVFHPPAAC